MYVYTCDNEFVCLNMLKFIIIAFGIVKTQGYRWYREDENMSDNILECIYITTTGTQKLRQEIIRHFYRAKNPNNTSYVKIDLDQKTRIKWDR